MTQAGIPVPDGFVILSDAFERFIKETDLNVEIDAAFNEVNTEEIHTIDNASNRIRALIINAEISEDIEKEIIKEFGKLKSKFVAVRSSATAEDSASAAWAGQLETYLNTTKKDLLENVKKCWASLFTPRAIFYRFEQKLDKSKVSVAVVIQKMVESDESGIAFSVHPVTEDYSQLIIEAGFGLGEAIVSGQITPDSYVVDKQDWKIIDINVNEQSKAIYRGKKGGNKWKELGEKGKKQVLTNKEIIELSKLIVKIEKHYGFPVDVEWAKEEGKFYITQSRPITTLSGKKEKETKSNKLVLGNQDVDTSMLTLEMTWRGIRDKKIKLQIGLLTPDFSSEIVDGKTINAYIDPEKFKIFVNKCANKLLNNKELLKKLKDKSEEFALKLRKSSIDSLDKIDKIDYKFFIDILKKIKEYQKELASYGTVVAFADVFGEISNKTSNIINSRKNLKYPSHICTKVLCNPKIKSLTEQAYQDIKKSKKSNKYLAKKYFWLNQGYIGRGINKEEIEEIKKEEMAEEDLPKKEELIKKLSLNKKEKDIINLSKELIYIKSLRADSRQFAHVVVNKIIDILSKKWKEDSINLEALTVDELIEILEKKKKIPKNLESRRKHSLFIINGEDYNILLEDEVEKFLEENVLKNEVKGIKKIKGQTANPGRVKGKIKLVFGPQHNNKVDYGDVLVSTATSPQLLPAMKKASAFVTDLGGITSHAAIVSRELNKPCVVGTKNATQILEDGMEVEVDADKGIVRIIERAKK